MLGDELDLEGVQQGRVTPVFFGSAMNNFGVELFLQVGMRCAGGCGLGGRGSRQLSAGALSACGAGCGLGGCVFMHGDLVGAGIARM